MIATRLKLVPGMRDEGHEGGDPVSAGDPAPDHGPGAGREGGQVRGGDHVDADGGQHRGGV